MATQIIYDGGWNMSGINEERMKQWNFGYILKVKWIKFNDLTLVGIWECNKEQSTITPSLLPNISQMTEPNFSCFPAFHALPMVSLQTACFPNPDYRFTTLNINQWSMWKKLSILNLGFKKLCILFVVLLYICHQYKKNMPWWVNLFQENKKQVK